MARKRSTPLQNQWTSHCDSAPPQPVRIDFDGSEMTTPPPPPPPASLEFSPSPQSAAAPGAVLGVAGLIGGNLTVVSGEKGLASSGKCDLSGVNFIFDGIIYHLQNIVKGGFMGGIAKMWYNILPFMIDAVNSAGGQVTNCQVRNFTFDGASNVMCDDLSRVERLPGEKKVFWSSYYRGVPHACFIHMVYDQIPERTGMDHGRHTEYWPRIKNMRHAGGFLSISRATTDDMCALYGMCDRQYVATSDNRISSAFWPRPKDATEAFQKAKGITKPYFLAVGQRFGYKNYAIFWEGIGRLRQEIRDRYMVVLVGKPPHPDSEDPRGMEVKSLQNVDEEHLALLYSGAAAFVYPSRMEGFGMPPLEAAACGANLILGPFHRDRMPQVFGDLASYATTGEEMEAAMTKVYEGKKLDPKILIQRASGWGSDPRHGWNEVAKDYLEYMIHGPFRQGPKGSRKCGGIVQSPLDCRFVTTETGLVLAPATTPAGEARKDSYSGGPAGAVAM
uniref:Glycosyl transferase family 1 domain-containing protein n=1 Tax=Hemiselmis tepida TaxID=464990 RepID=A0A7S0W891_9CRYP